MNFLGKIESGYLQLLRITFLILATISLIIAVVLAVPAWTDYRAKPAEVAGAKPISASAFHLDEDASSSDDASSSAATGPDTSENAKLTDELVKVLDSHAKKMLGADYKTDKSVIREAIDSWASSEDHGVAYVKAQTKYMDEVLSRADVAKRVNGSEEQFYDVRNAAFSQFAAAYQKEKDRVAANKEAAEEAATKQHLEALKSISVIGGAVGTFVTLVLMLVMFRVDRSIRQIALLQKKV